MPEKNVPHHSTGIISSPYVVIPAKAGIHSATIRRVHQREECRRENEVDPLARTTPGPSLAKEGNLKLPSSDEEGTGVVGRRAFRYAKPASEAV